MTRDGPAAKPFPLYEQVKRHILDLMAGGTLPQGTRLPSEHALMADLGVSRMTVHRALRELSAEGYVSRQQGVGSFVAAPRPFRERFTFRDMAAEVAERGGRHVAHVVLQRRVAAGPGEAVLFERPPGTDLFRSVVLHRENGLPVLLEERLVSPAFAPGYLDVDLRTLPAARYLQQMMPAEEVEHEIGAERPSCLACDLLEIAPGEPCLVIVRRGRLRGAPVTHAVLTYPGARYRLRSQGREGDDASLSTGP